VKKDEARAAPPRPPATPRTIRSKTVTVNGSSMALYSFDGRTWASRPEDLSEFEQRAAREKLEARRIIKSLNWIDSELTRQGRYV